MILCFIADGRSMHTQRWVQYFSQQGHEVHLITYDPMDRPIDGVIEHVVPSWCQNVYLSFWPRHQAIARIIRKIKPDLVHAHFITKYGFHLPFLGNYPKIVTAWGDDILILPWTSRILYFFTRHVLRSVDLIYAVSHDIQNHIINDFGIQEGKVHYLPFGVDTDLFFPKIITPNDNQDTIIVFSNRRFFPVYDISTLINGFAKAYESDKRLSLILKMDGPDEKKYREQVISLGISDIILFKKKTPLSNITYADIPDDYRSADIYITTSLSDGTPVSLLEAMASGLPCIATSVGGIPEWVNNNITGLLIEPGSPDQVASALLSLARDPELRKRLGNAAREVVVNNGQWKTLMEQAEKDYQGLIKTYRQDSP
jgi:glycosyltransferase involved in cell wall biosynthesis